MSDELEIVEGSERDFGYVVREDGVYRITVGYTEAGDKVKVAEELVASDELARNLALQSVYGDAWEPDEEAAFDELAGEHGVAGAAVRIRYPDWDERQAAYQETVDGLEETSA